MFTYKNPYNLTKIADMPAKCEHCGLVYQPEPGFYTGAMYVNYAFTVVLTAVSYLVLDVLLGASALVFFSSYIVVLFLLGPLLFRYSRVVYSYLFNNYGEDIEAIDQ